MARKRRMRKRKRVRESPAEKKFLDEERNILAEERTLLAYIRTILAFVAVVFVLVRIYYETIEFTNPVLLLLVAISGIIILEEFVHIHKLRKARRRIEKA